MKPFAVAGVQMMVSAHEENISLMERYAAHVRQRFPWVDMLPFSELAAFGPDPHKAVPMPGDVETRLCDLAERHGLWLVPGSLFSGATGSSTTPRR